MNLRAGAAAALMMAAAAVMPRPAAAAAGDIVLYATDVSVMRGNWSREPSSSGAGGTKMFSSDHGWSSTSVPLASPRDYFEATFSAQANRPYRVWLRLRGTDDSKFNESVWVQFSSAENGTGSAVYRIGTTSAILVNMERCSGCGVAGWGWQDGAYWLPRPGQVQFRTTGPHTIRVQTREDGAQVDQIVLSPSAYLSAAPGAAINDATVVPKSASTPTAAPFTGSPASIPGTIQAEAFDEGGEGVAYHDVSSGNSGGAYRSTDVDVERASSGGYNVGWMSTGEWLQYTVDVQSAGAYLATFRVANHANGGTFHLESNGTPIGSAMRVPNTGGWQNWQTVSTAITLSAGVQALRVVLDTGGDIAVGNLDAFTIAASSAPPPPPASTTGQTITVPAGGDLQAAINAARLGDTLLLQPGAVYTGAFELPAKTGTGYLTIRSATADSMLPGADVRISPADAPRLPRLVSIAGMAVLRTRPGAHHYRLQYLELTSGWEGSNILELGAGSGAQSASDTPADLIVDHCYLRGDPLRGQKRGIALNSARTTIRDSYIANIKSAVSDAQAIAGWNGPGPYTITNNYLEASGENVMFGGSDPTVTGLVPSDITLTRNSIVKQPSWRGQGWTIKNLLELKNAQRVRIDGNLFEYNWAAAQIGFAIVMTPRNQGGTAPWSVVRDVEFTNNIVRHVAGGINILGQDYVYPSQPLTNVIVRNNLFEDVSGANWGGQGRFLLATGGDRVTIDHNTIVSDGSSVIYADDRPTTAFTFTSNILRNNNWAIMGSDASQGLGTIAMYFPNSTFLRNVIAGAPAWMYPTGNFYPASWSDVGFADPGSGNYQLSASSPYRNAGADGMDVGVRFDLLNAALGH